jgi:ABC-type phosphate transport system substrate-binding protein
MKRRTLKKTVCALSLLAALAAACVPPRGSAKARAAQGANEIAIIVNKSNPVEDLSVEELREYFLTERGHWPNGGGKVRVVMLDPGLPARDAALRLIYNMSEKAYASYFLGKKFRGELLEEPRQQSSAADVIKFVSFVPGAIGYVRPEEVDASVKVIRVGGLAPGDPGYKLKL